jgi:hypothetical protein
MHIYKVMVAQLKSPSTGSGAKVFSFGSIQWAWGLDSDGVASPQEDIRAKQITINVLKNMGTRPQTPNANLIFP